MFVCLSYCFLLPYFSGRAGEEMAASLFVFACVVCFVCFVCCLFFVCFLFVFLVFLLCFVYFVCFCLFVLFLLFCLFFFFLLVCLACKRAGEEMAASRPAGEHHHGLYEARRGATTRASRAGAREESERRREKQ